VDALSPFRRVWLVDFEFTAPPGERPIPLCCVARELRTGRLERLLHLASRSTDDGKYILAVTFKPGTNLDKALYFPRLKLAAAGSPASLLVGENVHVSKPHEKIAFTECIIAADPNRVKRLFASSLYWPHRESTSVVGYLSDDGGATWATSLELVADPEKKERLLDQAAIFGPDGDLYFAHTRTDDTKAGPDWFGKEGAGSLDWLCLPALAAAWETRGRIDRQIDRPWLAVDQETLEIKTRPKPKK
jgi:hypothetical protein